MTKSSSPRGQGAKRLRSYRLDSETLLLMALLADKLQVGETEVIRLAVRVMAFEENADTAPDRSRRGLACGGLGRPST